MSIKNKKRLLTVLRAVFSVLLCCTVFLVLYISSPLHPKNISDRTVAEKGTEYTVRLSGISEYDERGFRPVAEGFYLTSEKLFVYTDEQGFARVSEEQVSECYALGKYSSFAIDYENYTFCGEKFKSREELETFFNEPDRIYNFDINKLNEYIQDIIAYEKHFNGTATVKLYKGRCVITAFYIGGERVLELNK